MVAVTAETKEYRFDGLYEPADVSRYLRVGLPHELQKHLPPTTRRIWYWIHAGIVAQEHEGAKAGEVVLNFEDVVTCQAVALFREAGLLLHQIRTAEDWFSRHLRIQKPFAHREFWYSRQDILTRLSGEVLVSGVRGGQLALPALESFILDGTHSLRQKLGFSRATSLANIWEPYDGVTLEPDVQFGAPCVKGTRIPTSAIWSYVAGGDTPESVAGDFGLEVTAVEPALSWERQLRAISDDPRVRT